MTDEMKSLGALAAKAPDILREMIGFVAERVMPLAVVALTGAR
jgi:hypothetical protein